MDNSLHETASDETSNAGLDSAPADAAESGQDLEALYDALNSEPSGEDAAEPTEEQPDASDDIGAAGDETQDDDQTPDGEELPDTEEPVSQPHGWSADKAPLWDAMSRDAQEYVANRELQLRREISQLGNRAHRGDTFQSVVDQWSNTIPEGMGAPDALNELFQAHALLQEDPVVGIRTLMHRFSVDLAHLAQSGDQRTHVLEAENAAHRVAGRLRENSAHAESRNAAEQSINEWRTNGDVKPHFDAVYSDMVELVKTIDREGKSPNEILDEAYEKAIWLNADIREQQIAERQKKAEKARLKRERDKRHAEDSAKSERLSAGQRTVPSQAAKPFSVDDDAAMSQLYDEIVNRS